MKTHDTGNRETRSMGIGPAALAAIWLALGALWAPAAEPSDSVGGKPVVRAQVSARLSGETARNLWDNNPDTYWQTPWGPNHNYPHDVVIDLGAPRAVTGLKYLRADDKVALKDFEVYAGADPKPSGKPVARGVFKDVGEWQQVNLAAPVQARYVVLRCLSVHKPQPGHTVVRIAELRVVAADAIVVGPPERFLPPQTIPQTELGEQYNDLVQHLRQDDKVRARRTAETFHAAASLAETDRDPADIVARRAAALLADLRSHHGEGADRATLGRELESLREQLARVSPFDGNARYALYERICQLRRRIAFGNPLLNFQELLFIKRNGLGNHPHMCDQYYGSKQNPGGGVYVLCNPFAEKPEEREVLKDSVVANGRLKGQRLTSAGSFLSPALSFDAKRLAFAYVECTGDAGHTDRLDHHVRGAWSGGRSYHVFTANLDGSDLRMLTDGTWNDFAPCFMPSGRIAFISERRGGYVRCGRACPSYGLHDMAADGTDIRCLSFHETNEWSPAVAHDGMILWTRWDYVDRHGMTAPMPWITTPDGRNPRPVHGNYRPSRGIEIDARPIPGSGRLVATVGPHHGWSFGSLVIVNPAVRDDDDLAPLKRLTADVGFPEGEENCNPIRSYGQAWPLSEDYQLCVYRCERDRSYGLYLLDALGNRELIWRDKELHSLSPMPVKAMPIPPVVPELARAKAEAPAQATVAVVDVYDGLKPWPKGAKIAALRVMQLFPTPYSSAKLASLYPGPRIKEGGDSSALTRASLGTVPVEADGSAHFVVPAGKPLFFQALDAEGLAITSMRSETHFLPGERATCQGCHEPKHAAPPPLGEPVRVALRRSPSRPQPEVNENAPISFPRLVQPVLDKHCVACHAKNAGKAPGLERSLMPNTHGTSLRAQYFASYVNLLPYAIFGYEGDSKRTIPGKFGARASKLYGLLSKGHHDVKLSADEMRRITLWLDSMSQFYGVYDSEGQQKELRGEYAKPPLE